MNLIQKAKKYPITYTIILINIIVFVITKFMGLISIDYFGNILAQNIYISGSGHLDIFSLFRILLSGFTHFSIVHIFFNMWFLYYVGPIVETFLQKKYYLILYFGTLIMSGIGVIYLSDSMVITIGASGALYGLLAFLVTYYLLNQNRLKHVLKINGLLLIIAINFVFSFTMPSISYVGHLGGFISGIFLTIIIDRLQKRNLNGL